MTNYNYKIKSVEALASVNDYQ